MSPAEPKVPRFQDLTFAAAAERLDALADELERRLAPGWRRAREHENREQLGYEFRVFERAVEDRPKCLLFVTPADGDAYVSNIVRDCCTFR